METFFKSKIQSNKISYRQCALAMGIPSGDPQYISAVANGKRNPSRKWRMKFLQAIQKIELEEIKFPKKRY